MLTRISPSADPLLLTLAAESSFARTHAKKGVSAVVADGLSGPTAEQRNVTAGTIGNDASKQAAVSKELRAFTMLQYQLAFLRTHHAGCVKSLEI